MQRFGAITQTEQDAYVVDAYTQPMPPEPPTPPTPRIMKAILPIGIGVGVLLLTYFLFFRKEK